MKEVWKKMSISDLYECSNLGRIRSVSRLITRSNGRKHTVRSKILSPASHNSDGGYYKTMIRVKDKYKTISFHREILKTWRPHPIQDKLECNHIDGNKYNNNICNLEWVTKQRNIEHSFEIGLQDNFLKATRERNIKNRKLTEEKLTWAKNERKLFLTSYQDMANKLGVHKKTLMSAMKGKTYKDIQEDKSSI